MSDDIREGLREAINEARGAATEVPAVEVAQDTESVSVEPSDTTSATVEVSGQDAARDGSVAKPVVDGRARDATGKFIKAETSPTPIPKGKVKAVATTPPQQGEASGTPPPVTGQPSQTPQPKYKAPQSWSPTAREHWAAMSEAAQAEVDRREREIAKALQEASEPKRFHQQFQQTVAPYEAMIRSQGGDPIKYVGNLLQAAYALSSPASAPQVIASLMSSYRIPPDAVNSYLNGETAQPSQSNQQFDPQQLRQQIKQEIMQEFGQQREQSVRAHATKEVESFGADKEFFEDLREDIADIFDAAARRGRAMTLEQAYNRAKLQHKADEDSEIGKVLRQREAAEAAKAQVASTQRASNAASSVKSQPAVINGAQTSETIRDTLRETLAEYRRR